MIAVLADIPKFGISAFFISEEGILSKMHLIKENT